MFKKLGIGCLGLIVLVLVFSVFASQRGGKSHPAASSGSATATKSDAAVRATQPTTASAGASAVASAKPTDGPKLGSSRTSPVPFGQSITLNQGGRTLEARVLEVQRDATAMVQKANSLNPDPKEGLSYVAIKMRLSYLQGPADKPYKTPSSGASLFAKSRMWGTEGFSVPPSPSLGGIDVFPGATVEGWISPLQAPKDAMGDILLSWGKDLFGGGETWFSLDGEKADAGPAPVVQAPPAPSGPNPGSGRGNPVPLGQAAKVTDGKATFEVSVLQVERNASVLVKKANMFNADPEPGMDYLTIKIGLKYLSGPQDKPAKTPTSGASLFAQNRMWGTAAISVAPSPQFVGQDIFPGAEVEGWLSPIILPKEAMNESILSYGKGLFGDGETWFALK